MSCKYFAHINDAGFDQLFATLTTSKREAAADIDAVVAEIITTVKTKGNQALIEYSAQFDDISLTTENLRIAPADIEAAESHCAAEVLAALDLAAERITAYHQRQKPADDLFTDATGVELGHRWTAIESAGIYVPGGLASYPSSVLMNAIPAQVAGVGRLVMVVPTPSGEMNPLVLAAAKRAGIREIYRIGGAQAIAALAYGTETIAPVDVITGPGNAYVATAKKQVYGQVGIDMIAGPSEILVVADRHNNPDWIASDLLSQAEHDKTAQSILICDDREFAASVETAIDKQMAALPRQAIARASWQDYGAILLVDELSQAATLINPLAPEHLLLAVETPKDMLPAIKNAGAIFLGRHTPEAVGDYVAGANHVLPTARTARYASGLSVYDFMKRSSLIGCSADSLAEIGEAAAILADAEGLDAHARSIRIRLNK